MRSPRLWLGSVALLVACGSTLPSFEVLDDDGAPPVARPDGVPSPTPDASVPRDSGPPPWVPVPDSGVIPPPVDAGIWPFDAALPWEPDAGPDAGSGMCNFRPSCLSAGSASGAGSTALGPLQLTGATVSYLGGFSNATLLTLFAVSGGSTLAFELPITSASGTPAVPAGDYTMEVWSYGGVPGDSCFSLPSTGTVRVLRHRASPLPREGERISFVGTFSITGSVTFSGSFDLRSACGSALSFE